MKDFNHTYIYGEDSYRKKERFESLVGEGKRVYLSDTSWKELLEEFSTPSLFARSDTLGIKIMDPQEEKLEREDRNWLEQLAGKVTVIILSEVSDKSQLKDFLKQLKWRFEYYRKPYENELIRWVKEEFEKRGKRVLLDAVLLLISAVGEDTLLLHNEIEKLSLSPFNPIMPEHIIQSVAPLKEFPVWDLEIAIFKKEPLTLVKILESLKKQGIEPPVVVGIIRYILNKIGSRVSPRQLLELDRRIKSGYSPWQTIEIFLLSLIFKKPGAS